MAIHKDLADTELHEPKGMLPLTGGASDIGKVVVSKGDGTSEARKLLVAEVVGAAVAGNRVTVVNTTADLPTPSGGTITLLPDVTYLIADEVNIGTDSLTMGLLTSVVGLGQYAGRLVYTGTSAMFESTTSHTISNLTLEAANGKFFNHSDSVFSFINHNDLILRDNSGIGTFNSTANSALFMESVFNDATTPVSATGWSFTGNWELCQGTAMQMVQTSGSTFDFGVATFNSIGMQGVAIILASPVATAFTGAANSANLTADSLGKVTNCLVRNPAGGTVLSGIADDDFRWRFQNSTLIRDSRPDALFSFSGGVAETVISTISVPVEVNATWTIGSSNQFTTTTDGRSTFIGEVETTLPIIIRLTGVMASGGQKDMLACIALNGVAVVNSITPFFPTNSQSDTAVIIWQHTFQPNDYVEIFVSNESDTVNFIAQSATALIN